MLWLALIAAVPTTHLYHVDLSRAVLATAEGRAAQAQVSQARQERQSRLQVQRERLLTRKSSMNPAAFAARVDSLNQQIEAAEAALEKLQQDKVDPIVAKLDAILAKEALRNPAYKTVALADVPVLKPRRLCDRTGWLAEAYRGEAKAPVEIGACRVQRFAGVHVHRALTESTISQAEDRRLRALQDKRQQELDRLRKEVTRLSAEARRSKNTRMATEAERQRTDLDRRFARFQAELASAERVALTKARRRLDEAVAQAQKAHPQVVFVDTSSKPSMPEPQCDATQWLVQVIDGGADVQALPGHCRSQP